MQPPSPWRIWPFLALCLTNTINDDNNKTFQTPSFPSCLFSLRKSIWQPKLLHIALEKNKCYSALNKCYSKECMNEMLWRSASRSARLSLNLASILLDVTPVWAETRHPSPFPLWNESEALWQSLLSLCVARSSYRDAERTPSASLSEPNQNTAFGQVPSDGPASPSLLSAFNTPRLQTSAKHRGLAPLCYVPQPPGYSLKYLSNFCKTIHTGVSWIRACDMQHDDTLQWITSHTFSKGTIDIVT